MRGTYILLEVVDECDPVLRVAVTVLTHSDEVILAVRSLEHS